MERSTCHNMRSTGSPKLHETQDVLIQCYDAQADDAATSSSSINSPTIDHANATATDPSSAATTSSSSSSTEVSGYQGHSGYRGRLKFKQQRRQPDWMVFQDEDYLPRSDEIRPRYMQPTQPTSAPASPASSRGEAFLQEGEHFGTEQLNFLQQEQQHQQQQPSNHAAHAQVPSHQQQKEQHAVGPDWLPTDHESNSRSHEQHVTSSSMPARSSSSSTDRLRSSHYVEQAESTSSNGSSRAAGASATTDQCSNVTYEQPKQAEDANRLFSADVGRTTSIYELSGVLLNRGGQDLSLLDGRSVVGALVWLTKNVSWHKLNMKDRLLVNKLVKVRSSTSSSKSSSSRSSSCSCTFLTVAE